MKAKKCKGQGCEKRGGNQSGENGNVEAQHN